MLFTPTLFMPNTVGWTGPTSGLISQWWLDDSHVSGTTITDSGSNSNTGTAHGGVSSTSSPSGAFYGTARAFDGASGTYISLSQSTTDWSASFTLAMWVYLVDITAAGSGGFRVRFFTSRTSGANEIGVLNDTSVANGTIGFAQVAGSITNGLYSNSPVFVNNTWCHVGYTFNSSGSVQALYVNGSSVSSTASESSLMADASTATIGGGINSGANSADPNGRIYNIVLYNRALTSGEMLTLATAK